MVFGVPCYYSIIQPILTDTQYKGSLNNNQARSNSKPSAVVEACTRFSGGRGKAISPISVIWKTWLRPHRRVSLRIRSSRMSRYCWETSIPDREHSAEPQREEKTWRVRRATRSSVLLEYAVWMGWVYHETEEAEALGTLTGMDTFNGLYLHIL